MTKCRQCQERTGWPQNNGDCFSCFGKARMSTADFRSLTNIVAAGSARYGKGSACAQCQGTGWDPKVGFCMTCFSWERGSALWSYISERYFKKSSIQPVRKR